MKSLRGLRGLQKLLMAAVFMLFGGFFSAGMAVAEETPDYRIQITPAKVELDLEPGKVTTMKFKVQNTGAKEFEYQVFASPYSVSNEKYEQDFSAENKYTYLAKWIKFSEESGKIAPDGEEEITVTVEVPKDVPAGGQYAAIFARMIEPESENDTTGITALKQVGMLIYSTNVDGNTRETGNIVEAKVPSFMFAPPIKATSVVENTGNVHADATYIMQVYPLFGDEEVYTNEENPEKRTILPETRRLNTLTWDGAPQLGIFKVKQTVKFLDEVKEIEKVVFICPIWFLLIILVLIFLAVFWIVSRTRGRKE